MPQSNRLRNQVHRELTALLASPGGPLAAIPTEVAAFLDEARLLDTAAEYRDLTPDAPTEGRAAIITAGPPGAGKSTALSELLHAHRRIDPDEIKDLLLARLECAGLLEDRNRYCLLDDRLVQPAELAWWVHKASTDVADLVRQASLSMGENFAVEGTLSWEPLIGEYSRELAIYDYESLVVLDVEVPFRVAIEHARQRWWAGREASENLGGRFIPDAAIAAFYPDTNHVSVCAANARGLHDEATHSGLEVTLALESRTASGTLSGALIEANRIETWRGLDLAAVCVRCGSLLSAQQSIRRGLGEDCYRHLR